MGNPSELLASAGAIGIRPEGPGQGSKQGGRHGKPSITLHCPPHGTPRSWADALSCTDGHYSPPLDLQEKIGRCFLDAIWSLETEFDTPEASKASPDRVLKKNKKCPVLCYRGVLT